MLPIRQEEEKRRPQKICLYPLLINSRDPGHHSRLHFFQMSLTPDDVEGFSSVSLDN